MTINKTSQNPVPSPIPSPLPNTQTSGDSSTATTPQTPEKQQLHVTRELDGVNSSGIIGELLTQGTGASQLAQTNKLFMDPRFKIKGLLDEVNGALNTTAVISGSAGVLCADDMYVAGDPWVGGKKNNYQGIEIQPQPGYYTMFKDGLGQPSNNADLGQAGDGSGRKILVNSHVGQINEQGNTAFTEYGFVIQDDQGKKYNAVLSGGELAVTGPDGKQTKLISPNDKLTIGDPNDPVAKFYYADMPGGKDGTTEKRLVFESYEKPTQSVVDDLAKKGVALDQAKGLRSMSQMTFGFRVPDGLGDTYRMSDGVKGGAPLTRSNGVATYYDAHFSEGKCQYIDICPYPPPPVAQNERAKIWGDPHIIVADDKAQAFESYNFNHTGMYNIIKDQGLTVNANSVIGPNNTTILDKTGISIGDRTLLINADGTTSLGNVAGGPAVPLTEEQTIHLGNGSSIKKQGSTITIINPEYDVIVTTNNVWREVTYLNIEVKSKSGGVLADRIAPTGLLGETFDADDIIERQPKLPLDTYRVSSLLQGNNTPVGQTAQTTTAAVSANPPSITVPTTTMAAAPSAPTTTTTTPPATTNTTATRQADTVSATSAPAKPKKTKKAKRRRRKTQTNK